MLRVSTLFLGFCLVLASGCSTSLPFSNVSPWQLVDDPRISEQSVVKVPKHAVNFEISQTIDPSMHQQLADRPPQIQAIATFAGGCFWCMESPFDKVEGVISTTSGYTGGSTPNPTYAQVSSGTTGHAESVQVVYDPSRVDYATLLQVYWRNIDPLDEGGQFCDRGNQYRSAIFYHTAEQKASAIASKQDIQNQFDVQIVTEIVAAETFYPAEDYHQDYYKKQPLLYNFYRFQCGRDRRLNALWE